MTETEIIDSMKMPAQDSTYFPTITDLLAEIRYLNLTIETLNIFNDQLIKEVEELRTI